MITDFYISFSAICFTILGLWLVVVQQRYSVWAGDRALRRRSYGVALHFSLPGIMTLLALVDPQSPTLWRTSYAIIALGGVIVLATVRGAAPDTMGKAAYIGAIVLYAVVGVVAIVPHLLRDIGITAAPVRVEAVLLSVLVFLGVNVAWLLLFERGRNGHGGHADGRRPVSGPVPGRCSGRPGTGRVAHARARGCSRQGRAAHPRARGCSRQSGPVTPGPGARSARRRSGPAGARSLPSPRTGTGGRRTCRRSRARTGR